MFKVFIEIIPPDPDDQWEDVHMPSCVGECETLEAAQELAGNLIDFAARSADKTQPILTLNVPTYLGEDGRDYADDSHPVHVYDEAGVRLSLGGPRDTDKRPDIMVEKFAEGWRVFIHPANADPDYVVELRPKSTRVEDASGELIHETQHDWSI